MGHSGPSLEAEYTWNTFANGEISLTLILGSEKKTSLKQVGKDLGTVQTEKNRDVHYDISGPNSGGTESHIWGP